MTFVGKVLVFIQIAMSIFFMAFAGAVFNAQTNWKTEADKYEAQADQERKNYDEADKAHKDEKTRLDANLKKATEDAALNLTSFTDEKAEHKRTKEEHAKANEKNTELAALVEIAQRSAKAEKTEKDAQRVINKGLNVQNVALRKSISDLKDENFAKDRDVDNATRKVEGLLVQNKDLLLVLNQLGIDPDPKKYKGKNAPPPNVEGLVFNSRKNDKSGVVYVEITIGSDDGLDKGHDLYVYRRSGRGKYLGKIRIIFVTSDRAVGQLVERAKNSQIMKGDNVSTKL
jgi:Na+-transporting methylmalonyl-CoA/oxaloacetate decarboxylase gamma subunit